MKQKRRPFARFRVTKQNSGFFSRLLGSTGKADRTRLRQMRRERRRQTIDYIPLAAQAAIGGGIRLLQQRLEVIDTFFTFD